MNDRTSEEQSDDAADAQHYGDVDATSRLVCYFDDMMFACLWLRLKFPVQTLPIVYPTNVVTDSENALGQQRFSLILHVLMLLSASTLQLQSVVVSD